MSKHTFKVAVSNCSREEAERVMAERIDYEEDYGFEYSIEWSDDDTDICRHCKIGIFWDDEDETWRHFEHEGITCGSPSTDTIAEPMNEEEEHYEP